MEIEVFSMLYNEERIIRQMIEYYEFAKITFIDSYSTDNSLKICDEYANVSVIEVETNRVNDNLHQNIKNEIWKNSKADWVIVIDTDEFIYQPNLLDKLESLHKAEYTLIKPLGYTMVSKEMPAKIIDCKTGYFEGWFSKPCIFNPQKIKEINFCEGGHWCNPKGLIKVYGGDPTKIELKESELNGDIKLLHYHYVGWSKMLEIQAEKRERSKANRMNGYGSHWGWTDEKLLGVMKECQSKSEKVI